MVQGCAGSGKTSVALHRIAYLLYHNRNALKAAQILVLSPNSIFGDYISRILPELGEENICEMTLDDYAYRELRIYGEAQDRYDVLERKLRGEDCSEADHTQNREYVKELDLFILQQEWENVEIDDISYNRSVMKADRITKLFYEKFSDVPFLKRMDKIADYFIDEQETIRNKDMEEEEKELICEKFRAMYVCTDIFELYQQFLMYSGRDEDLIAGRTIPYEHVYPLLYLKYSLEGVPKRRRVRHLLIDEMQDYSYIQYSVIRRLFDCSMTILGDRKQTMEENQSDVMRFLPEIFGRDITFIRMDRSYRSTVEIMTYAESVLGGGSELNSVERHGETPGILAACSEEEEMRLL